MEKDGRVVSRFLVLFLVFGLMAVGVFTSYALVNYKAVLTGNEESSINTCFLNMDVSESDGIKLDNAYPVSDEVGMMSDPYTITINKGDTNCNSVSYELTMVDADIIINKINPDLIKYEVSNKETNEKYSGVNPYNMNINDVLDDDTVSYDIRIWISADATNEDVYVYDVDNNIMENEDGSYITKGFSSKVQLDVMRK